MSAHMSTTERVILFCNAGSCEASFTVNSVGAVKTRDRAAASGWRTSTREDRRDFCPQHAGMNR